MRYNRWRSDPESRGDASNSISARDDLSIDGPVLHGGVDSKITSYTMFTQASNGPLGIRAASSIIAGPTSDDPASCPPFSFAGSKVPSAPQCHYGMPDTWDFDWVLYSSDDALSQLNE